MHRFKIRRRGGANWVGARPPRAATNRKRRRLPDSRGIRGRSVVSVDSKGLPTVAGVFIRIRFDETNTTRTDLLGIRPACLPPHAVGPCHLANTVNAVFQFPFWRRSLEINTKWTSSYTRRHKSNSGIVSNPIGLSSFVFLLVFMD